MTDNKPIWACDLCMKSRVRTLRTDISSLVLHFGEHQATWADVCENCTGKLRRLIDINFPANKPVGKTVNLEINKPI